MTLSGMIDFFISIADIIIAISIKKVNTNLTLPNKFL